MAKYEHFEDLPVWQELARFYNRVLDLLEKPNIPFTPSYRSQLERAALSVSNNIAEGFERMTTGELISFLTIARGSAGEVRSMVAVVQRRPKLAICLEELKKIRSMAESCARQLSAWVHSIEDSPVKGKRHLSGQQWALKQVAHKAANYRIAFLRNLKPEHPLYNSSEAREARNESVE